MIKEYDKSGNLLFDGKYIKGKRNGKGKEYHNNELIFEGEYLDDKKWNGKGKEYAGKYLNGERNGKGKEYFDKGFLVFEDEYFNGKNGMGKDMTKMLI